MLTISVRRAEQLTDELLRLGPALVYVPLDELAAHPEKAAGTEHTSIGVSLPRVAWDREYPGLREKLELDPANPEYIRTKWGVGYYLSSQKSS